MQQEEKDEGGEAFEAKEWAKDEKR